MPRPKQNPKATLRRDTEARLKQIGKRVQSARISKNWTLQALASEAQTTKSGIFYIENGSRAPSVILMERIAEALDLPYSYFLT